MTSRNSFLANLKEDNKRRLWLWLVAAFVFIIFSSLLFLVVMASIDENGIIMQYGKRAEEILSISVSERCGFLLGMNFYRAFISVLFAILAAYSGFSYLNDRVKVDFYVSMPQKKSSRFLVSWINGIIIYICTYIIGALLCFGMLGAMGYAKYYSCFEIVKGFVNCFILFLGTYHITILAVALTGNIFAAACAFVVLNVYEFLMRALVNGFKECFLNFTYNRSSSFIPIISPIGQFIKAIIEDQRNNSISFGTCFGSIVVAALILVLAYIAYIKRPMEAASKTLAFKWMHTPLKLLIAIPASAAIGLISMYIGDEGNKDGSFLAVVVIVMIVAAVIISSVIEAVFDLDVKAVIEKKSHWLICTIAAVVIFFSFRQDIFGLDRHIPSIDSIESVAIDPYNYNDVYQFFGPNGSYMNGDEFVEEYMYITDIDPVVDLVRLSMDSYDSKITGNFGRDYRDYLRYSFFEEATVFFRTKSGKVVCKKIYVPTDDERAIQIENKIFSSKEFKEGYYSVKNMNLEVTNEELAQGWNTFSNGLDSVELNENESRELLNRYAQDIDEFTHMDYISESPIGEVSFALAAKRMGGIYGYTTSMSYNIYPSMTRCMEYVKELGLDVKEPKPEDIANVTVYYSPYYRDANLSEQEYYDMIQNERTENSDGSDNKVKFESEDVAKFYDDINFTFGYGFSPWGTTGIYDGCYDVEIELKNEYFESEDDSREKTSYNGRRGYRGYGNPTTVYGQFKKDGVPQIVKESLGKE